MEQENKPTGHNNINARKRDQEFEKAVKHASCDNKLQPEESFIMKVNHRLGIRSYLYYQVVHLDEILEVRHSVFVIGAAGTGLF